MFLGRENSLIGYTNWSDSEEAVVRGHSIKTNVVRPADRALAIRSISSVVPIHYASEERIAGVFGALGRAAAARFILEKLPVSKKIRSGDVGEILASEYIEEGTSYLLPIKRLRWKDHREMAMRGDDAIGIRIGPGAEVRFLKVESKSRASLPVAVVNEARVALDKDAGLPSPHALGFVSSRLWERGEYALSEAVDRAQLVNGINSGHVEHMLFTFSGNSPITHFTSMLNGYAGVINQLCIGVRVDSHGAFISEIYEKVIQDAGTN